MCACQLDVNASSKATCKTVENDLMHCIINESKSYIETLSIKPIDSLPHHHEVLFQSQLLNARDPAALQVRYRTIVSSSALRELRNLLNRIIID